MAKDVTKMDSEDLNVSPYLLRPLRRLADVMQAREGSASEIARETINNVLIFHPKPR